MRDREAGLELGGRQSARTAIEGEQHGRENQHFVSIPKTRGMSNSYLFSSARSRHSQRHTQKPSPNPSKTRVPPKQPLERSTTAAAQCRHKQLLTIFTVLMYSERGKEYLRTISPLRPARSGHGRKNQQPPTARATQQRERDVKLRGQEAARKQRQQHRKKTGGVR